MYSSLSGQVSVSWSRILVCGGKVRAHGVSTSTSRFAPTPSRHPKPSWATRRKLHIWSLTLRRGRRMFRRHRRMRYKKAQSGRCQTAWESNSLSRPFSWCPSAWLAGIGPSRWRHERGRSFSSLRMDAWSRETAQSWSARSESTLRRRSHCSRSKAGTWTSWCLLASRCSKVFFQWDLVPQPCSWLWTAPVSAYRHAALRSSSTWWSSH